MAAAEMESESRTARTRAERARVTATAVVVLAAAAALPLVFVRDVSEGLRLPKELLLRSEALLLVGLAIASWLADVPLPRVRWRDRTLLIPFAALAAAALLTLTSTKPELSRAALATAAATFVVYLGTVAAARRAGWLILSIPIGAAALNAALTVGEETGVWMPFGEVAGIPHHVQCTALIGNPNEIGSYLGAAALAFIAFFVARKRKRPAAAVAIAIVIAGLLASRTLTAIIALFAATIVMSALSSWRVAARVAIAGAVAAALLVAVVAPYRERAADMLRAARIGDYNELFTERLTPFAAAGAMFLDHPLTGVGPGAFAWQYFDYKVRAELRYPSLRRAWNRGVNYGEVHNDHLQTAAEGGIIGYAAFAAVLIALGSLSFAISNETADPRQQFARRLALPLATFWAVLSLAQFPLETTVVRALLVHLAAVCVAWRVE
jgi:O-antigen ligase